MRYLKRLAWLLVPGIFLAYLAYFLEPSKPLWVLENVEDASNRRDLAGVRCHFADQLQTEERGPWFQTTPSLLKKVLGWDRKLPADLPVLQYEVSEFMELNEPLHRYITIRPIGTLPSLSFVRLRWTGLHWKVDGNWARGCMDVEVGRGWIERCLNHSIRLK